MTNQDSDNEANDVATAAPRPLMDTVELSAAVLDQAPDAVVVTDRSGAIRIWNRRATDLFGFSAAEAAEAGLDIIIPSGLRDAHWRGFNAAMESGKVKSQGHAVVTRAVHKDGRTLYLELSFALLVDKSGKAIGAIAIGRDVTDAGVRVPRPKKS